MWLCTTAVYFRARRERVWHSMCGCLCGDKGWDFPKCLKTPRRWICSLFATCFPKWILFHANQKKIYFFIHSLTWEAMTVQRKNVLTVGSYLKYFVVKWSMTLERVFSDSSTPETSGHSLFVSQKEEAALPECN